MEPINLLGTREVAERLGLSTWTVQKLAREGVLPTERFPVGGPKPAYLFHPEAVAAYERLLVEQRAVKERLAELRWSSPRSRRATRRSEGAA